MSTTAIGRQAEAAAAKYLASQGYKIKTQNWRTRLCEIDIIATKSNVVYFIEVKYRKSVTYGDGLDAITNKKLQQMTFAADLWVQTNKWPGDYRLVVISASGQPPKTDKIIEI
jgi:uncharacterized protein (TIGR00252 family)